MHVCCTHAVAAPRPHQSSRSHDAGDHDAAQASRGEGAPAVAERPRALRDPHQAAGKDTRGEKHTGGRRWPHDASQRPWRLPQRRLLGRVRDIIRLVPVVRGLAALLFQGLAASPSCGPFSAGQACRRCRASRHRHSVSALTPRGPSRVAGAPCARATTALRDSHRSQWPCQALGPDRRDGSVRDAVVFQ